MIVYNFNFVFFFLTFEREKQNESVLSIMRRVFHFEYQFQNVLNIRERKRKITDKMSSVIYFNYSKDWGKQIEIEWEMSINLSDSKV